MPRSHSWLIALICVLAAAAVFALGMYLLPHVVERPRDGSGFAGALYDLRDRITDVLGISSEPAGIHLFQTASTNASVGSPVQFNITTTKAVQDVGITDAGGSLLPSSRQCMDPDEGTTWLVTIRFDSVYVGDVYAAVQEKDGWH